MNNEIKEFISLGLSRYNEAHNIYWRFREETQKMLTLILENRENFGKFEVDKNSFLSRAWVNGLILNSRVDTYFNEKKYSIGLGLDWTNSEYDLPIPFVWIEDEKRRYINLDISYKWKNTVYEKNYHLGFFNNYKFEDLEDIFESLLNEFIEYLDRTIMID